MRDPDPTDIDVLDAAAAVLRAAAQRQAVIEAAVVAIGFLALLLVTGLSVLVHPAAPLLVLAVGIAAGTPVVGRLAHDPGDPTPPRAESLRG